jgi:hypothetical protein
MTDISVIGPTRSVSEFSVGGVASTSASILARNALLFLPISAITALPIPLMMSDIIRSGGDNLVIDMFLEMGGQLLIAALTNSVLIFATFQVIRGQRPSPIRSVQNGLRRFVPVVVTSLAQVICIMAAAVFLLIPGFILSVMLFLVIPACVVERLGTIESFSRSIALTRGYRWQIFGMGIAVGIVNLVVNKMLGFVAISAENPTLIVFGSYIWMVVLLAYLAVMNAVAYHDIRVIKEGIDIHRIAAVFD